MKASVNFFHLFFDRETFHQLPSIFRVAGRPSVNFRAVRRPSKTSVYILCIWETFRQFLATFHNTGRPFGYLHQLSVLPEAYCQLLSTFHADHRPSVNFLCSRVTFRQLPSTIHAAGRPSINFRQLSLRLVDFCQSRSTFLATSTPSFTHLPNFLYGLRLSDSFRQFSVL